MSAKEGRRVLFICPDMGLDGLNGSSSYIMGLAKKVVADGNRLTVLAIGNPPTDPEGLGELRLVPHIRVMPLAQLVSRFPVMTARLGVRRMRSALRGVLSDRYDLAVVHHLASGWAWPILQHACEQGLVDSWLYASQNDEVEVRQKAAKKATGIRRRLRQLDAIRVRRLQSQLLRLAPHVTAITATDADLLRQQSGRSVSVLTPGFTREPGRFDELEQRPRAIVVVGSLTWEQKRTDLIEFLDTSAGSLALSEIDIEVAGRVTDDSLSLLRSRFPSVHFHGTVTSARDAARMGRLAVVHEPRGGGFKMKVLDYIAAGTPILATGDSLKGSGLEDGVHCLLLADIANLSTTLTTLMDDTQRLERIRDAALQFAEESWPWGDVCSILESEREGLR